MAFNRPSLPDLKARVRTDLAALPGSSPRLRYSVEGILGDTLAALAHGLYGYIDKAVTQLFPDTADDTHLRRWAAFYNVIPLPATMAHSPGVIITGSEGAVCPAGTVWQRTDGVQYSQDASAEIAGGTATIAVTSITTGLNANADAGTPLSIVSPVAGIHSAAVFDVAATGGADNESIDSLRMRLLQRLRFPPMSGGPGNYVSWALEVAGVTRAWEIPKIYGPGTVGVLFVRDNDPDIIPSADEVAEVQEHIDAVAPIAAVVTVLAPVAKPLDPFITPTPGSDPDVKAAIIAQLSDYLLREGSPGVTLPLSQIAEAISQAEGLTSFVMTSPSADVTHLATEIPVLGVPVWGGTP